MELEAVQEYLVHLRAYAKIRHYGVRFVLYENGSGHFEEYRNGELVEFDSFSNLEELKNITGE